MLHATVTLWWSDSHSWGCCWLGEERQPVLAMNRTGVLERLVDVAGRIMWTVCVGVSHQYMMYQYASVLLLYISWVPSVRRSPNLETCQWCKHCQCFMTLTFDWRISWYCSVLGRSASDIQNSEHSYCPVTPWQPAWQHPGSGKNFKNIHKWYTPVQWHTVTSIILVY